MSDYAGMAEWTRVNECIGMASGMAEPTGMVGDRAKMAESDWMPFEMIEAIVTVGACWVVEAIGMIEASGMLVVMSIFL
jgi:hypothetical protein